MFRLQWWKIVKRSSSSNWEDHNHWMHGHFAGIKELDQLCSVNPLLQTLYFLHAWGGGVLQGIEGTHRLTTNNTKCLLMCSCITDKAYLSVLFPEICVQTYVPIHLAIHPSFNHLSIHLLISVQLLTTFLRISVLYMYFFSFIDDWDTFPSSINLNQRPSNTKLPRSVDTQTM